MLLYNHATKEYSESTFHYPWLDVSSYIVPGGKGGSVPVLFIKRKGAKMTLLYSHDKKFDLGSIYFFLVDFATQLFVNVIAYELPGCGCSTMRHNENGLYESIRTAYSFAVDRLAIPSGNIILYGHGFGSAPTIDLALTLSELNGVILESPFASPDFDYKKRKIMRSARGILKNYKKIKGVKASILYIHGKKDALWPVENTYWLLEHTKHPYNSLIMDNAGYMDIRNTHRECYFKRLRMFIDFSRDMDLDRKALSGNPATCDIQEKCKISNALPSSEGCDDEKRKDTSVTLFSPEDFSNLSTVESDKTKTEEVPEKWEVLKGM